MDKELEALLKEAHSMGASEADLDRIVGAFKKKIVSSPVSKGGVGGFGLGSNPFQSSVNTSSPSVLTESGKQSYKPTPYVKPATKPKTLPEAVDDDNNYLGAVWNQIANSGSDFIGGMTRLIAKSNPYGSPVMAGVADELGNRASIVTDNSFRTESSSKSNEEKIQSGFDLSNGISLDDAKALPLLISRFAADVGLAIPTAGASFIAQGYNTGLKEYDKATEGQPVDQNTRELFGIGYAGINGLLDKLSLGLITKSPTVAKGIKKTILGLGIKELAKVEGKITNEIIEQTFNKVAKQSFNKIKTAGVKAFTSGAIEGSTESGQGALSDGLKLLTNKLSDREIFNKEEIVEGFLANRINDFGGGAILGGAMGGGMALMSSKSIIAKRVAESTTPEQLDLLKNEIASEVEAGTMDADRAESLMVAVDKYAGAKKKLPSDLSTKQTEKALDTIIERDTVAETIKQKTEQAAKSDEALAPQTQQELDLLEAKRQSLNDNIVEVTTDEKYSYSVDPESGKYFKQLGEDGKPEEITEQQYKLEKQVAPNAESDGKKTLKQLEGENKSTLPKVPAVNVFTNKVEQPSRDDRSGIDALIDEDNPSNDKTSELPIESVSIANIIPTQKNLTIQNLDGVKGVKEKAILLKKGDKYFIIDGHHRVANQILNGETAIDAIVYDPTFEQYTELPTEQTNLDSKPQDDLLLDGEQVTGEPTNTDTAVETNQGAGAINQATNNTDVSEVGGEAVNTVLQKAETDLAALKQVENKTAKYEGSVKRLTEAKNAGQITEQEFNDTLNRFDDVMAEYTPKGAKSVNLNESIPDGVLDDSRESKSAKAKELSGKIRALKIGGNGKVFDSTLGLPVAIWDGAIETVALAIEAGAEVANAIKRGVNYIQKNHRGQWNKKAYNDTIIKELGLRGIEVNGEDLIVKPLEDKQTVELINGFYSPLEKGIAEAKTDQATGKGWMKVLSGVTESDELNFTGVNDFLNKNADSPISKKELLDYMKDNRIEVIEVAKQDNKDSYTMEDYENFPKEVQRIMEKYGEDENSTAKALEKIGYEVDRDMDGSILSFNKKGEENKFDKATKFAQYQLEGEKENYKEVLVTLPQKVIPNERKYEVRKLGNGYSVFNTKTDKFESLVGVVSEQEAQKRVDSANNLGNNRFEDAKFKSSHFEEPNILVHLRMNTRTDAEGNKVLFIEEVQSDWGQKGKREGFDNKQEQRKELEKRGVAFNNNGTVSLKSQDEFYENSETWDLIKKYNDTYTDKGIVSTAPFVTDTNSWVKLGLKTALKEAVAQKADKIAWTTGEQQNDRYDLSKTVDYIQHEDGFGGTKYVDISTPNGLITFQVDKQGKILENKNQQVPESVGKNIADVIGKDITDRILTATKGGRFEGDGLKVGGKGMKGFYGSPTDSNIGIIGGVAKSLFKQEPKITTIQGKNEREYKGKVYTADEIDTMLNDDIDVNGGVFSSKVRQDLFLIRDMLNRGASFQDAMHKFSSDSEIFEEGIIKGEINKTTTQHSIDITPELIASVKSGLPLFKNELSIIGEVKKPSAEKLTEIKARRDAAYKRIRAKGAQANTLFSPEVITDLVEIGSTYIEEGIVRFSDFAERLQKEYGKEIPTSVIKEVYEKSAEANGLGVRKFPESVQNSELSQEVKEETLNTSTPYTKQDLHDLEDKVDAMSEMDRMAEVAKLNSITEGKEGDLNIGVLAGISLMNEYSAAGKVEEAGKIADMLSQSATIIAQTLRQFGQLRKSSAASFIAFVEKHLGEKGKKLNDAQRKRITELFEKQKQLFQELEIAQEAYAENLDPVSRKKYYDALEAFDNATRNIEGYLEQLLPRDLWDTLSSILKGNLLTFKSLLANPLYNVFYLPVRFGRGEIANAVDFIISNVAKTPRSKASSLTPTSAILAGRSLWTGLKTATKNSLRGNTGGDLAKYDVGRGLKPIEAWKRLLSPGEGRDFSEKLSDFFEGTIGISANLAFRGLPFGDAPFSELAKNQRLYEIAVTKGLKGQDIERFMIKPDDDSLKDARSYGDSATFQDNNALSTAAKQTLKAIEESAAKVHPHFGGAVKLTMNSLFPFIKTPASVALKIVQYSTPIVPTVRAMFLSSEALKSTENFKKNPSDLNRERVIKKQRLLSEAMADVAIASALTAAARIIVANGLITGSAPEEKERKKERDFMFATQPPFTMNISGLKRLLAGDDPTYKQGDTTVTYNVLGIMGAVMGIVNDTRGKELREEAKNAKKVGLGGKPYFPKEESGLSLIQELITDGASTLPASVKYLTEQSFLQGVESVMGAISKGDYDRLGTQLYRTMLNLPVPNTYTQVNKAFRETMKDPYTDSQWETFANIADERLGNGEGLPERLNIWGEPVPQTPEGSNKFLYQAVDPFRTQSILTDPITMKVFDIQRKSQSTDAIPPSVPRYIIIRGERRDLDKKQYQEYAELVGGYRKRFVEVALRSYTGNENEKMERYIERLQKAYSMGSDRGKKKFLSNNRDLLR